MAVISLEPNEYTKAKDDTCCFDCKLNMILNLLYPNEEYMNGNC